MSESALASVILLMREYQKKHDIKDQCLTNTQYAYDCWKNMGVPSVKAKAVIALGEIDDGVLVLVMGHVLLSVDGLYFEPSYRVFSLKNVAYYDSIKDLKDNVSNDLLKQYDLRQILKHHISFVKLAEGINNGELLICDKKYYDDQADYVEDFFKAKKLCT
jgi:hypothetical protein